MQDDYIALKREILELKTAQPIPCTLSMFSKTLTATPGRYTGIHRWKITFKDVGDTNAPIVAGDQNSFLKYDPATNTMEIFEDFGDQIVDHDQGFSYPVRSTREIVSIVQQTTPLPSKEWVQVREFYPADMGNTPGWCLQNCRLGYHIYSGTYATARADMEAQQANGTLHSGTPPDYIAVPVYYANYNITTAGHVAVWNFGVVWSDKVPYQSIDAVTNSYVGWGEFCDGQRVVQHV